MASELISCITHAIFFSFSHTRLQHCSSEFLSLSPHARYSSGFLALSFCVTRLPHKHRLLLCLCLCSCSCHRFTSKVSTSFIFSSFRLVSFTRSGSVFPSLSHSFLCLSPTFFVQSLLKPSAWLFHAHPLTLYTPFFPCLLPNTQPHSEPPFPEDNTPRSDSPDLPSPGIKGVSPC